MNRCKWANGDMLMEQYHDTEWGVPVHDDTKLFEFLILDTFQAGLSWKTILHKREAFRAVFDNFDAEKIVNYDEEKIQILMNDKNIVRNEKKIRATVTNAKAFLEIKKEYGSFDKFIWQFTDNQIITNKYTSWSEVPATSPESENMSKALKKKGFSFVGSTICYAFMQAIGMINDHEISCFRYAVV